MNALLHSLDIDSDVRGKGPLPGRFRELEDYWNESQGMMKPGPHVGDAWAVEFNQHRGEHSGPDAWVNSFEQQHGANGWASEFEQARNNLTCIKVRLNFMDNLVLDLDVTCKSNGYALLNILLQYFKAP